MRGLVEEHPAPLTAPGRPPRREPVIGRGARPGYGEVEVLDPSESARTDQLHRFDHFRPQALLEVHR